MSFPIANVSNPNAARWIKRSLLGVLLTTSALMVGCSNIANPSNLPPNGTLVDVGGSKLDLFCQGTASGSTVILDAGNGETSLTWTLVQPEVAKFSRVCAYDRAGYAWSEASTNARSVPVMVDELHALLKGAGIQGPVVLVGHSLGGIIARQYAAKYSGDVSGLVLVDSAHEAQFQRLPASVVEATASGLNQLKTAEQLIGLGLSGIVSTMVPLEKRLPADIAEKDCALMLADPKQVAATRRELEELMKGDTPPVATLGALPLVVLSRGKAEAGMDDATTVQKERVWTTMQLELAALSSRTHHVIAKGSGHGIQLDEPQVVIDAIREVWTAQR
jgi:pimeloyl-ACP methyl ester carboxylesterase